MLKGLLILIKERFHPLSYFPMILFFSTGLGFYLLSKSLQESSLKQSAVALVILISFFLRLRLFDEIKDYQVDLKHNPGRPLARGVLTIDQVKVILLVLIIFEVIVVLCLGLQYFLVHVLAILYSLLMYEEFFIGKWIRPHLTTYAVLHTFVSCLSGFSAAFIFSRATLEQINLESLLFFSTPWFYFNLFEFSRKTFAVEEERPLVDTYSLLFGPVGAWALSVSQVVLGLLVLRHLKINNLSYFYLLAIVYLLLSLNFIFKTNKSSASFFRLLSGLYLIAHFGLLTYSYWR